MWERLGFDPWGKKIPFSWARKIPWRRDQLNTPVLLPGEFHGQRRLAGYTIHSKESEVTERLSLSTLPSTQSVQFRSLSRVRLFATPWTAACQASLSITNSWSSLKLMSIELVMPSSHLILCRPLLLFPSIFPSIRGFSNESARHIRWPKDWSFSFSISFSNEYSGLIFFRLDWFDLLAI